MLIGHHGRKIQSIFEYCGGIALLLVDFNHWINKSLIQRDVRFGIKALYAQISRIGIQSIGIVTSKTGAAIQDILKILSRRAPYAGIIVKHTAVQGTGSAEQIAEAVHALDKSGFANVIIVGRGGGSLEDLWAFNEEAVAAAVFECETPVISAVGHETDMTICDMAADFRAPTPSAAAEIAARPAEEIMFEINSYNAGLSRVMENSLRNAWQELDSAENRHWHLSPNNQINRKLQWVDSYYHQLRQMSQGWLKLHASNLSGRRHELHALNPEGILDRGYAIATKLPDKTVLKDPEELTQDDIFELQLSKGKMTARKTVKKNR